MASPTLTHDEKKRLLALVSVLLVIGLVGVGSLAVRAYRDAQDVKERVRVVEKRIIVIQREADEDRRAAARAAATSRAARGTTAQPSRAPRTERPAPKPERTQPRPSPERPGPTPRTPGPSAVAPPPVGAAPLPSPICFAFACLGLHDKPGAATVEDMVPTAHASLLELTPRPTVTGALSEPSNLNWR